MMSAILSIFIRKSVMTSGRGMVGENFGLFSLGKVQVGV
jgi:hypothetical protein